MKTLLTHIHQGSRILFYTGLIHLVLFLAFLILLGFDSREVNDENVWLKPLRFALSIWLFTWTYAWFSSFVMKYHSVFNVLNYVISLCMFIEIILISFQASRGLASHFNNQTNFDATIFSIMGAAIGFNAVILGIWFLVFTLWERGGQSYRKSITWGMAIFLLGNFSGYLIIRYGWPTDILPSYLKMPITGWKLTLKDLKISHAIGLHAIQVLPITHHFIKKLNTNESLVHLVGILYLILYFGILIYALM